MLLDPPALNAYIPPNLRRDEQDHHGPGGRLGRDVAAKGVSDGRQRGDGAEDAEEQRRVAGDAVQGRGPPADPGDELQTGQQGRGEDEGQVRPYADLGGPRAQEVEALARQRAGAEDVAGRGPAEDAAEVEEAEPPEGEASQDPAEGRPGDEVRGVGELEV